MEYWKGGPEDCYLFDSWFASKKAAEAAMELGVELIGMVKTNTKGFCKNTIEELTKDWPGGSYIVLRSKPMVPGCRPLIAIGYKYNARKVLSFIVTDNTGSTKTGFPRMNPLFPQHLWLLDGLQLLYLSWWIVPSPVTHFTCCHGFNYLIGGTFSEFHHYVAPPRPQSGM